VVENVQPPPAERVRLTCPECGKGLQVKAEAVGRKAQCPECKAVLLTEPEFVERAKPPAVRTTPRPAPAPETREKSPSEKYCAECGAIIRARASICPECGVSQTDLREREKKYCHECGEVIRAKAEICPKCGVRQTTADYLAPADEDEETPSTNRVAAGILGILLGGLGIHKFILGYSTAGIIMLLVTILTCGVGGIAMWVIGLVEGIIYLTKSERDFYQTYVVRKKEWF
jgi:TM2 domain-containing membrane protein YozV/RNA polymerase subunit RPABC4/transcription elongation factor Spt4